MPVRHIRTPFAAVAVEELDLIADPRRAPRPCSSAGVPPQTLWADRPLQLRQGRVLGVRERGGQLRVALRGAQGLSWVAPAEVLTEQQAQVWVRTSRFSKG